MSDKDRNMFLEIIISIVLGLTRRVKVDPVAMLCGIGFFVVAVCFLMGCGGKEPDIADQYRPAAMDKRITEIADKQIRLREQVSDLERHEVVALKISQSEGRITDNILDTNKIQSDRITGLEKEIAELRKRRCPCCCK